MEGVLVTRSAWAREAGFTSSGSELKPAGGRLGSSDPSPDPSLAGHQGEGDSAQE